MNGEYKIGETVLGSWTLVKLLGEGAYGKVYEAHREGLGAVYTAAIKVMTIPQSQSEVVSARAEGMDEESIVTYFRGMVADVEQEFALMSRLKGMTNIVSCEDFQVEPHTDELGWDILIRMELLTPMLNYMSSHQMTRSDVIKLGVDMCHALELCQRYNIIHRDIKPENIFISDSGDYKLGDFGVARTLEKTTGGLSKKGTYTYMAPEIYKDEKYGSSVDIYSLGIVLYRLLNNNRAPFLPADSKTILHSERERALVRRISGEPLPPPANADGRLAEIVLKACAYEPKDRYSSPLQMRQELEAIQYNRAEDAAIYGKAGHIDVDSGAYTKNRRDDEDEATVYERRDSTPVKDKTPGPDDEKTVYEEKRREESDAVKTAPEPPSKKKTGRIAVIAAAAVALLVLAFVLLPKGAKESPSATPEPAITESPASSPAPASTAAANPSSAQAGEETRSERAPLPELLTKLTMMSYEEAIDFFFEHNGDGSDLWSEVEWVPDGRIYYSESNRLISVSCTDNIGAPNRIFFFFNEEDRFEYAIHVWRMGDSSSARSTAADWETNNRSSNSFPDTNYTSWGNCMITIGGPRYSYGSLLEGGLLDSFGWIADCWNLDTIPENYDAMAAVPAEAASSAYADSPVFAEGSFGYGSLRITATDLHTLHVALTDERIPDGYPISETPGKNDASWNIILEFASRSTAQFYLTGTEGGDFQHLQTYSFFEDGAYTISASDWAYTLTGNTLAFDIEFPQSLSQTVNDVQFVYLNLGTETENFVDHFTFTPAPVPEDYAAPTPAPAAETPAPTAKTTAAADADGWRELPITLQGDGLQVLSCRYRGGPEISQIDFFVYGGINGGCELDVTFADNQEIAAIVAAAYFGGPISEEDIEMYRPFGERYLRDMNIPLGPQSKIGLNYGPISASDMTRNDNSDFLLWFGANTKGEIVSTIIVEVGVPTEQDLAASSPAVNKDDLPKTSDPLMLTGTVMRQSKAKPEQYQQVKQDYPGLDISDNTVLVFDAPISFVDEAGAVITLEGVIVPSNDVMDYMDRRVTIMGKLNKQGESYQSVVYGPFKPENYTGPGLISWNPFGPYMLSVLLVQET